MTFKAGLSNEKDWFGVFRAWLEVSIAIRAQVKGDFGGLELGGWLLEPDETAIAIWERVRGGMRVSGSVSGRIARTDVHAEVTEVDGLGVSARIT